MGEKSKNLWRNGKRVLTTLLLWLFRLGVPAGIGWIVFLLLRHVYPISPVDFGLEKRIAFVSMWVAIVGFSLAVAGTVIAVLQFQASQRKPDLHLWIGEIGHTTFVCPPTAKWIPIRLVVQNTGTRVARFVKCEVRFLILFHIHRESGDPRTVSRIDLLHPTPVMAPTNLYLHDYWKLGVSTTPDATFVGGDHYIVYDDESGQDLGLFQLDLQGLEPRRYEVRYRLRCEGMERKQGVLWIEVPEDASS